jgi:hypothetical protein
MFGFLPGAYIGGLVGLKLAEFLWDHIIEPMTGPRILVALFDVLPIGWIIGYILS